MCKKCQEKDKCRVGTINQIKRCRESGITDENAIGDRLDGMAYVSEFVVDTI